MGFHFRDTWNQNVLRPTFTYYHIASHIDRFYLTPELYALKSGIRILPVAFTDCTVELRVNIPTYSPQTRQRRWKLYPSMVKNQSIQQKFKLEWVNWKKRRRYYADVAQWWERCVKRRLKNFISKEMAEQHADYKHMENHLYVCIYDILNSDEPHEEKIGKLHKYKAKLIRLHAKRADWIMLDQADDDAFHNEQLSLYQVLKQKKRCAKRMITE
jgi:hypothetical protein